MVRIVWSFGSWVWIGRGEVSGLIHIVWQEITISRETCFAARFNSW